MCEPLLLAVEQTRSGLDTVSCSGRDWQHNQEQSGPGSSLSQENCDKTSTPCDAGSELPVHQSYNRLLPVLLYKLLQSLNQMTGDVKFPIESLFACSVHGE